MFQLPDFRYSAHHQSIEKYNIKMKTCKANVNKKFHNNLFFEIIVYIVGYMKDVKVKGEDFVCI